MKRLSEAMGPQVAPDGAPVAEDPPIPVCGTCHEPTREAVPAGLRKAVGMDSHPRDCRCERTRKEAAAEEQQLAAERGRRRRNLYSAGIPAAHANAGFGNLDMGPLSVEERKQLERAIRSCRSYVDDGCKGAVLLAGTAGVAKSHLAVAILRSAILDHGRTGRYWNWTCAWGQIRSCYARDQNDEAEALMDEALNAEILVLDDVGMTVLERGQLDRAYEIVEHRSVNRLPWIVTTNASKEELAERLSPRIADRLLDARWTLMITISGRSWRQR